MFLMGLMAFYGCDGLMGLMAFYGCDGLMGLKAFMGLFDSLMAFMGVSGKLGKRSSMLHIMVLLKFLGSYDNEVALQKLGLVLGISKGAVNNYIRRACNAILKHREQVIKWPSIEE